MLGFRKVHEDSRGDIYVFNIGDREILLFFTKKEALRGGHSHALREYGVVIEGDVERRLMFDDNEVVEVLSEGDLRIVPPKIPHLIRAKSDCWIMEWHEYPKKRDNYPPYRKLVEESIIE